MVTSSDNSGLILIEATAISKSYFHRPVVDRVSLTVRANEITTIIGPNGGGKTTLARLLLQMETPNDGTVRHHPALRIGYVPQSFTINPLIPLSVASFLALARHSTDADYQRLVTRLQITHLLPRPVQHLSGGEKQRVLLAYALLHKPNLLVLDEPVQGVDVMGQIGFYQLLQSLHAEYHMAILLISHDLHFVMRATHRVICMHHHICCQGAPEDVSKNKEYQHLFGKETLQTLGLFHHAHDHHHAE